MAKANLVILHSMLFQFSAVTDEPTVCINSALLAFNSAILKQKLVALGVAQATCQVNPFNETIIDVMVRGLVKSEAEIAPVCSEVKVRKT